MKRWRNFTLLIAIVVLLTGCFGGGSGGGVTDKPGGIKGQVFDRNGDKPIQGINVEVFHNRTNRIFNVKTNNQGIFEFKNLAPGSYTLTIQDADYKFYNDTNVTVNPERITTLLGDYAIRLEPRGSQPGSGLGHYIVIGADQYSNSNKPLEGVRADANRVYQALAEDNRLADFKTLLTTDRLADGQPTKRNIEKAITDAVRKANKNGIDSYLVIYFAGHASKDVLWPANVNPEGDFRNAITDGELELWLRGFPGDVTLILDVSYSGSMADRDPLYPEELAFTNKRYTILGASQKDQEAYFDPILDGGVFTHFLLEGISDLHYQGDITAFDLFDYVDDAMRNYNLELDENEKQFPFLEQGKAGNSVIYRRY